MSTSPSSAYPLTLRLLHRVGSPVLEQATLAIAMIDLFAQVMYLLIQPRKWRWNEISHGIIRIGLHSLPVISVSTAFAGLLITQEIAWHMNTALHSVTMIPGFTAQFIFRELGIAIPALLLVSKVGASIAAEVGTMKITEQIDALRLLGIDPVHYLVFPRFVAAIVSGACLTLIATAITLTCATTMAVIRYDFSTQEYLNALQHFLGVKDILCALVKGTVYGGVIPIVSCAYGFHCKGGAQGVGNATTNAVVTATSLVILLDFMLTYLFTWIL